MPEPGAHVGGRGPAARPRGARGSEQPAEGGGTDLPDELVDLGRQLQLTNSDKSRTFVSIYMHYNKLYVMEATVPAGYPEPGLFQQSLGWLNEQGNGIRYQQFYLHGAPPPPVNVRGGQADQAR